MENAEEASKAIAMATTPTQVRGREHTDAAKRDAAAGLALGFLFALLARGDDDFFLDMIFGFLLDIFNDLLLPATTTATAMTTPMRSPKAHHPPVCVHPIALSTQTKGKID